MALSGISFSVRLWCLFTGMWFLQTTLLPEASEWETLCFPDYNASFFCFEDFGDTYNVCVQTISGDDQLSIKSLPGCPNERTLSISFSKNVTTGTANSSQNKTCTETPVSKSFLLLGIQQILNGKYSNNCIPATLSVMNISVLLNTEFNISCYNETIQNVSWFKNSTQISSSNISNNMLHLGKATMDQNGTYFCVGTSASGLVLAMIQVTITASKTNPPSFVLIIICGVIAVFFLLGFILLMRCAANQANVKSQSRARMDSNVTSTMEY
ncbi:uncharacterized protein LOC120543056 isoform X2 [Polypterus senegalus]|nr:uncharacterized protein LOC120543056 isoform X2 [Polypterus senegalus]XP_039631835.1 uncharacterized protein LOC120543056 isoform X2 [Polypterus senegalus]